MASGSPGLRESQLSSGSTKREAPLGEDSLSGEGVVPMWTGKTVEEAEGGWSVGRRVTQGRAEPYGSEHPAGVLPSSETSVPLLKVVLGLASAPDSC